MKNGVSLKVFHGDSYLELCHVLQHTQHLLVIDCPNYLGQDIPA